MTKNGNKSDGKDKKSKKATQCSNNQPDLTDSKNEIDAPYWTQIKDNDGETVEERTYTYQDREHKARLLILEKQLIQLGTQCSLFEEGEWEKLCRVGVQVLIGKGTVLYYGSTK